MIKYYNRKLKKYETEKVAGEKYLNWTYSSPLGMSLLQILIKKKLFSKLYGFYCDTSLSTKKIEPFVENFDIDMNLCTKNCSDFKNFNDFFTRELKPFARPIDKSKDSLISLGDGRLLVYENIDLNNVIQVKGITYSLNELIKDTKTASKFKDGTCLVLRLCPTDYHRFHFIDDGICEKTNKIKGDYYSVNPIALSKINKLFCENKREWSLFCTENFGDVLYVEVGATCVGSIIQRYTPNKKISKGEEKGMFKFGGSTVILFFEKDKIKIDDDILLNSKKGIESKVLMGEKIGVRFKK